jgi:lipopolysaccharide transport system permease protein
LASYNKGGMLNIQRFSKAISLLWILSKQDLRNRYATSYGGLAWLIGVPLVNALVMAVVFSALMSGRMGIDYGEAPFVLFYFIPFSLWILFAEMLSRSTSILNEYGYLINKIAFPFWVLPVVPLMSALLSQVIIIGIVCILMAYLDVSPSGLSAWYGLIWLIALVLTVGASYLISAISVYLPDMAQVVPIGLNLLFWMTPILYPPSLVEANAPEWLQLLILEANPFYYLAEYSRAAILSSHDIPIYNLAVLGFAAILALIIGLYTFRKLKSGFADVI